jgi:hypothetical protein
MQSTVQKIEPDQIAQVAATVVRVDGEKIVVRAMGSTVTAVRAKSCLVAPDPGDRVLLATSDSGGAWVLAVLDGDPELGTRLTVETPLSISAPSVRVRATEDASIVAGGGVSLLGARLDLRAVDASVGITRLTATIATALLDAGHLKTVATTVDAIAERVTQRTKRLYRFVEELERVRAGRMDVDAGKSLRMHAENSLVTAETLVKLDGEHIHMG